MTTTKTKAGKAETAPAEEGGEPATQARPVVRVTAPAGPRRRAGLSFGPTPRDLTEADFGDTPEARDERMNLLLADPMLSVTPIRAD